MEGQATLRTSLLREQKHLLERVAEIGDQLEELQRLQEAQLEQQQAQNAKQQVYIEAMRLANEQATQQEAPAVGPAADLQQGGPAEAAQEPGALEEGVDF